MTRFTWLLAAGASASLIATSCAAEVFEAVTIPAKMRVTSITAHQTRAENANVKFSTNRTGKWQTDGRTGAIEKGKTMRYRPHYPRLFAPSRRPYTVRVGGQWMWGNTPADWAKATHDAYPDKIVVHLFTGRNEPENTTVTIKIAP